jgi:hypothetical protein
MGITKLLTPIAYKWKGISNAREDIAVERQDILQPNCLQYTDLSDDNVRVIYIPVGTTLTYRWGEYNYNVYHGYI